MCVYTKETGQLKLSKYFLGGFHLASTSALKRLP